MELTAKQKEAVEIAVDRYRRRERMTMISGYAGVGKAQPIETLIPTPEGSRKLGELKVGDYVYDRKGKPTQILGVYPQGKIDSYIVTLEDGRTTLCNDEHIFAYYTSRGNLATKTIREMLAMGIKHSGRGTYKFKIPRFEGIDYPEQEYPIDPYVIGAFLGDGCCKQCSLTISSENEEIPSIIGKIIGAIPEKQSEQNYNWTFKWKEVKENSQGIKQRKPQTKQFFSSFVSELCCGAGEKRIPKIYKKGSREQRFSLLQGLFDTDGSISNTDGGRFKVTYTSININLIKDIQEILYELGYKSTINEDKREDKYTITGVCYNLNVLIPNEDKINLFRLKRKRDIAIQAGGKKKRKDYNKIAITDIKKENCQREMVCIYVDNPEHLYVTNDYIVTHNTTVVKHIISALGLREIDVAYCAFTGKAAQVLKDKGNPDATTLHKLLYYSRQNPNGSFSRTKKPSLGVKVVVVDEVSMVPNKMIKDLLSFPVHLICCGDPAQLPPIEKNENNHLLDNPHIFLDQIMRQAAESEIIQISMKARKGEPLEEFHGKEVQIFESSDLTEGMLTWADAVLCATNKKRIMYNNIIRGQLGYTGQLLVPGEKLICLHNYYNKISENGEATLTNGTVGFVENIREHVVYLPYWLNKESSSIPSYMIDLRLENDDVIKDIIVEKKMLSEGKSILTPRDLYRLSKSKNLQPELPCDMTYGYAATVWKYQGSSAKKVLLVEEGFPFDKEEHNKFMYTGITRAENKLVIIKK